MNSRYYGIYYHGWIDPQKNINDFMIIEFNGNLKKIKKIRIEEERIQINLKDIDNIIELATDYISSVKESMEFYQLKYWNEERKVKANYDKTSINLRENARNNYSYHEKLFNTSNTFLNHFIQYRKNIHKYLETYTAMKNVLRGRNVCSSCLKNFDRGDLTCVKKKHKMCEECTEKNSGKMDCPVCLEYHPKSDMKEVNCGNGHHTCLTCYGILKAIEYPIQKCPLCRGTL